MVQSHIDERVNSSIEAHRILLNGTTSESPEMVTAYFFLIVSGLVWVGKKSLHRLGPRNILCGGWAMGKCESTS